jgi:hypothetical protein
MRPFALVALSLAVVSAGCTPDTPTGPLASDVQPSFTVAGASGCHVVAGTISETGAFPNFGGTVTGDLEGTSSTTIGFAGANGGVIVNPGIRTIDVTGGTVPGLIGATIEQSFSGLSVNTGAGTIRINERTTVESGAARGTLTTHGWLNITDLPWSVEVTYQGIICL